MIGKRGVLDVREGQYMREKDNIREGDRGGMSVTKGLGRVIEGRLVECQRVVGEVLEGC